MAEANRQMWLLSSPVSQVRSLLTHALKPSPRSSRKFPSTSSPPPHLPTFLSSVCRLYPMYIPADTDANKAVTGFSLFSFFPTMRSSRAPIHILVFSLSYLPLCLTLFPLTIVQSSYICYHLHCWENFPVSQSPFNFK